MRNLFMTIFEDSHFNTGISITAFSLSHIIYLILIAFAIGGGYYFLSKKEQSVKEKWLGILVYAIVISYVFDFFVHEFVYGGLNTDKLPFHICTVLCPMVAFVQFNKFFKRFKEPVVILSILAPMMYLCYPASVGSGEPWCYQAVQTMFYHGALMAWGILSVCLGAVEPKFKNIWHTVILLVAITLWASLGNAIYRQSDGDTFNWFFLEEDAFYIGLVGNGIIPKWLLMIINPVVFTMAAAAVYGVIILVKKLKNKKA